MSTYKGKDDCTDTVLELVTERESANYNTVIGHMNGLPGIELADLTIKQIYGLMDGLLNGRYGKRMPSTAMGKYQILRKTMKNLVEILKYNIETVKFTPEVQDRMGLELLKIRGYQKWYLGKLGNIEFAHRLSCEWASLPDPYNGGRSHYDGIAGNHAGMTLKHLYDGLDRAKALKNGSHKE